MEYLVFAGMALIAAFVGWSYCTGRKKQIADDARHIQHDRTGSILTIGAIVGAASAGMLGVLTVGNIRSPVLTAALMVGAVMGILCIVELRKRAGLQ